MTKVESFCSLPTLFIINFFGHNRKALQTRSHHWQINPSVFISIESIRMINNAKTNMTIFFILFHINWKLKFSSLPFVYFFVFVISYQSMMSIKYWTENTYEQIESNVDPRFCLFILFLDFNYVIHPSENHFRFHLRAGGKPYINFFSFILPNIFIRIWL